MASIQFYLRKNIKDDDNQHPLYARISAHQESRYHSLDIWVKASQWNERKQEVRKTQARSDNSALANQLLSEVRAKFNKIIREHKAQNKIRELRGDPCRRLTAQDIKEQLFHGSAGAEGTKFIAYARRENKRIEKEDRYNTFKKNRAIINKFEKYISGHPGIPGDDILFSEITVGLLKNYHAWLVDDVGNGLNTAARDIKDLGTLFNYAIADETISYKNSPFRHVSFPRSETKKTFLTADELEKIQQVNLPKNSLIWHVRNYFFFQIYTAGLRVSDLCVVPWEAITGDRFEYTMRKTTRHKSLFMVEPAREILSLYGPPAPGETIFPIINGSLESYKNETDLDQEISRKTALINKYLKKIEKKAKLKKHITTHIARHTFANLALKAGWSKEQIQKALAHSSVKQTEQYLSSFDDYNIDDSMENLFKEKKWIAKFHPAA